MDGTATVNGAGVLIREWRARRNLSQLDLALDAEVSPRHLSFVETGRSRPSRELVVRLAEELEVPLRERNALLLAAGYAPLYGETPLESEEMAPVRQALERILRGHEPFPAVITDSHWNLVAANRPAMEGFARGIAPELVEPPVNTLRLCMHPEGLAPRIANFAQYSAHLLEGLRRQELRSGDPALTALREELERYPGVKVQLPAARPVAERLFVPLVLREGDVTLTFFSTLATFGTALDITVADLAIESFFPADEATAAALTARREG